MDQKIQAGIYNGIRKNLPTRDKVNEKVTGASEKVSEAAAEFGKLINDILDILERDANTIGIHNEID